MAALLLALLVTATGIPRTADAELVALAELRASETAATGGLVHRPLPELDNGRWDAWSEILAYRGGDDSPLPEIVAAWLASPVHAGILRTARYTHIGCGFEWVGVRLYVACVLGDPRAAPVPDSAPIPPPAVMTLPDTAVAQHTRGDAP